MSVSEIEKDKPKVKPPVKSDKKQNPSRKRAQKKRHEGFRDIKNKEFTAKQDALIKLKLQPVFVMEQLQALNSLVPKARTVPIPVSTRVVGFSLYEAVRGSFGVNATINITRPNLLAVFRHLHAKMAAKWLDAPVAYIDRQLTFIPNVPEIVRTTIDCDAWMPLIARQFHQSLGPVVLQNGNSYQPVLPILPVVNGRIVPRPDAICINNLRDIVVSLADPATPLALRQAFFQNNPIPGAHWVNDVFVNADEIMPPDYGIPQMQIDANIALQFFSDAQKKVPKILATVEPEVMGSNSLLATIELDDPVGIPPMPNILALGVPQPVSPWIQLHPLPPMAGHAYYQEQLSTLEVVESAMCLFGKWLPMPAARLGIMTRRDPATMCQQLRVSRTDALTVCNSREMSFLFVLEIPRSKKGTKKPPVDIHGIVPAGQAVLNKTLSYRKACEVYHVSL